MTICVALAAQDYPITDRSFGYTTAYAVPAGTMYVETGYFQLDGLSGLEGTGITGQSLLLRTGLWKGAELRARAWYQSVKLGATKLEGLSPVELGIKQSIVEPSSGWPSVFALVELGLPVGSGAFRPNGIDARTKIIAEKYISNTFIIGINAGRVWRGLQNHDLEYSASLRTAITPEMALYTEFFGTKTDDFAANNFMGLAYEVWLFPQIVLDVAAGIGVSEAGDDHYWAVGLVYRVGK